jgi:hypothetical protein
LLSHKSKKPLHRHQKLRNNVSVGAIDSVVANRDVIDINQLSQIY